MSSLSKGLLESARLDRPTDAQRSRIWEQVALAPHLTVVAGAGGTSIAPAKVIAGFSATKLVMAGALAGTALTIGLGMLLASTPSPARAPRPQAPVAQNVVRTSAATNGGVEIAHLQTTELDDLEITPATSAPDRREGWGARVESRVKKAAPAPVVDNVPQDLMREAALVSQARTAIVQGRANAALDVLDLAARESSHTLEPEELSLRARALRLLGREGEAVTVEETLRVRYPGNFLSH